MSSVGGAKIPKAKFVAATETSLKVKLEIDGLLPAGSKAKVQYKEPHADWDSAKAVPAKTPVTELVDLKPGTPYYVRIVFSAADGTVECGDDAMFDTRPVECGPSRGSGCSVS